MPIITLITDWNNNDYYIGALKGKILQSNPDVQIIDLSHSVPSFNSTQAAFILKNSYQNFPDGTIHLVAINCEESEDQPYVVIRNEGQFFIGPDNGMFGLIFKTEPEQVVKIDNSEYVLNSFPEINILAVVASKIADGSKIDSLGQKKEGINRTIPLRPTLDPGVIMGSVIYIDSYLNAITNINKELFEKEGKGRKFSIFVDSNHYEITRINKQYNETPIGELLAIFNSADLLEIAIYKGQVATLLNLKVSSNVRIKFYDK